MALTKQDFKKLLVNRAEIEAALGVKIEQRKPADVYLDDYAMYEYINLREVVALFLGLNPNSEYAWEHPRFNAIFEAVEIAVRENKIPAKIEQDFDINGNEYYFNVWLTHDTAQKWANTHGLKWDVPPYRPFSETPDTTAENNNPDEIARLTAIIEQKTETIARLEAEIENLKKPDVVQGAVNYDDCSIYGHTTVGIKAIIGTVKKFWINHDLSQPDTIANASEIEKWIKETYSTGANETKYIQSLTRPLEAKYVGRRPKE